MLTFLVAWNPLRTAWRERIDRLAELHDGRAAVQRWGVRTRAIGAGDCVYFIRLGKEPRGVFARATAIEPSHKAPHWDSDKRRVGAQSWYVTCRFEELLDVDTDPLLDLDSLKTRCSTSIGWTIQGSGIHVPEPAASRLHQVWDSHCVRCRP